MSAASSASDRSPSTPLPWFAVDRGIGWMICSRDGDLESQVNYGFRETFTEADAKFIAHASAACASRDKMISDMNAEIVSNHGHYEAELGKLREAEARIESLELAADCIHNLAKLCTRDDGLDPEAWWIELTQEDAHLIRMVAEGVNVRNGYDHPNSVAERAAHPENYCRHNILKGHCPDCP